MINDIETEPFILDEESGCTIVAEPVERGLDDNNFFRTFINRNKK